MGGSSLLNGALATTRSGAPTAGTGAAAAACDPGGLNLDDQIERGSANWWRSSSDGTPLHKNRTVSPAKRSQQPTLPAVLLHLPPPSKNFSSRIQKSWCLLPASNASRHSKVTSNVSGFLNAVGLSRTTTLVTFTMDIFFELAELAAFPRSQEVSP